MSPTDLIEAGWLPEHPGAAWTEWIDPLGGGALPLRDAVFRVRLRRAVELLEQRGWRVTTAHRSGTEPGAWAYVSLLRGPAGQLASLKRALKAEGLTDARPCPP